MVGRTVVGLLIPTAQGHSSNLCLEQDTLMFVVLGIQKSLWENLL
jgi:hypothetical protein